MKIGLAFKYKLVDGCNKSMKDKLLIITPLRLMLLNLSVAEVPLVVKVQHSDLVNFAILSSNLLKILRKIWSINYSINSFNLL